MSTEHKKPRTSGRGDVTGDYAAWGRKELIYFYMGDSVRYHVDGNGPYHNAKVIRTARTRVLIEDLDNGGKQKWVPNLWLSHHDNRRWP